MRIAVIVPTTAGPRLVTGIRHRPRLPRSQIITDTDYRPLDDVSERYDDFISPAGPVRRFVSLPQGQFELRLDERLDGGRSWELPVALAHWAHNRGDEIVIARPERVIWATGSLGPDLDIRPDDYHVKEKLKRSMDLIAGFGEDGAKITLLVPPDDGRPIPAPEELGTDNLYRVGSLAEAISVLGNDHKQAPGQTAAEPRRSPVSILVLALALLLTVMGVYALERFGPEGGLVGLISGTPPKTSSETAVDASANEAEPMRAAEPGQSDNKAAQSDKLSAKAADPAAAEPTPIDLRLVEYRAPAGSSCIHVLLGNVAAVTHELSQENGHYPASERAGLCAIGLRLGDQSDPIEVTLDPTFVSALLASDRRPVLRIAPGAQPVLRLIQFAERDLDYTLTVGPVDGADPLRLGHRLAW